MNQILSTKLEPNNTIPEKKSWFKFQFSISILIVAILVGFGGFYFYHLGKKEDFSESLIANYDIYRLYSNKPQNTHWEEASNGIFGMIEIPKIQLYYPVFSSLTEELLKVSPCKFYGENPDKNGNICIAGHNYDNSLFFSKISSLIKNDEIYIFDIASHKYVYTVYDKYEVASSDLSPVLNYEPKEKILTLVTCNNFNSNRIIVRAKR